MRDPPCWMKLQVHSPPLKAARPRGNNTPIRRTNDSPLMVSGTRKRRVAPEAQRGYIPVPLASTVIIRHWQGDVLLQVIVYSRPPNKQGGIRGSITTCRLLFNLVWHTTPLTATSAGSFSDPVGPMRPVRGERHVALLWIPGCPTGLPQSVGRERASSHRQSKRDWRAPRVRLLQSWSVVRNPGRRENC